MKATKRIIAVALAVMILALMIPFAASASGYTAEITGKAVPADDLCKLPRPLLIGPGRDADKEMIPVPADVSPFQRPGPGDLFDPSQYCFI